MKEDKILFEIKESNLDTGLRGVPVGYCTTSEVHPEEGLSYRGFPIKELANREPEEVIYLLLNGESPTAKQLQDFKQEIIDNSHVGTGMVKHLESLPLDGHPMKWFISAINFIGMNSSYGKNGLDWKKDCIRLIGCLPTVVGLIYQIHHSWERVPEQPELGYIENFVNMIDPANKKKNLIDVMKIFNILHFDHGGGNLSTFVGKAISSGYADLFESITGAMCGLAGPLHGKANQECFSFIKECYDAIGCPDDDQIIYDYLQDLFDTGKKIFGFGHAVLRVEDTRATILYELGQKLGLDDPYFKLALKLRKVGSNFLSKQGKVSNPYPNVDSVSGSLLNATGLEDESYYTVLFGMSRCVGIACQIYHDRVIARDGKGTPIVRPKYLYSGPRK